MKKYNYPKSTKKNKNKTKKSNTKKDRKGKINYNDDSNILMQSNEVIKSSSGKKDKNQDDFHDKRIIEKIQILNLLTLKYNNQQISTLKLITQPNYKNN